MVQNSLTQAQAGANKLATVVSMWAESTTNAESPRRLDLIRDKGKAVLDFLRFTDKPPVQVTAIDVKTWQAELETKLAHSTVYAKISRVSSFYTWAMKSGNLTGITHNPVDLARPKAPSPYQNESAQSLTDEEAVALLQVVKTKAQAGSVVAKRDFALLLFYFFTGKRRREIIQIRWGDCKLNGNGTITITGQVKGGDYKAFEVSHTQAKAALLDYLETSSRLSVMKPDSPLWVVHDQPKNYTSRPLSSHGFVKNLKKYAKQAGLNHIHLHQTRHTFGRWVAEETGSITDTQDALGHKNIAATKVYVRRVAVKKDKHSGMIAKRLGL